MTDRGGLRRGQVILKIIGWGFLYAAFLAAVWEIYTSVRAGGYTMTTVGEQWYAVHGPSLTAFQSFAQLRLPEMIGDPVLQLLLTWPSWATLAGLGGLLLVAAHSWGQSRRRGRSGGMAQQSLAWKGRSLAP